jgi:hypothetical protein
MGAHRGLLVIYPFQDFVGRENRQAIETSAFRTSLDLAAIAQAMLMGANVVLVVPWRTQPESNHAVQSTPMN